MNAARRPRAALTTLTYGQRMAGCEAAEATGSYRRKAREESAKHMPTGHGNTCGVELRRHPGNHQPYRGLVSAHQTRLPGRRKRRGGHACGLCSTPTPCNEQTPSESDNEWAGFTTPATLRSTSAANLSSPTGESGGGRPEFKSGAVHSHRHDWQRHRRPVTQVSRSS